MQYEEQLFAESMHRALADRVSELPETQVQIAGNGVHWNCTASVADRCCKVHCFEHNGPEYLTYFKDNGNDQASGRTALEKDTVAAVHHWLMHGDVPMLYAQFTFVDQKYRALSQFNRTLVDTCPELAEITCEPPRLGYDHLWYKTGDRSCEIFFYGKRTEADAFFHWDECELFRIVVSDVEFLARVLKRWLCDAAMPSQLRSDFPNIEIGDLATHYEIGTPIEGEFLLSWDGIEEFYQEDWCTFSGPVLAMIRAMRTAGYDRLLRAGQSLSSLGLSRSRRHGLRNEQHCIWFTFYDSVMDVHPDFGPAPLKRHPVEFTKDVQALLDNLVSFEID